MGRIRRASFDNKCRVDAWTDCLAMTSGWGWDGSGRQLSWPHIGFLLRCSLPSLVGPQVACRARIGVDCGPVGMVRRDGSGYGTLGPSCSEKAQMAREGSMIERFDQPRH